MKTIMHRRSRRGCAALGLIAAAVAAGALGPTPTTSAAELGTQPAPHHYLVVSAMGTPTVGVLSVSRDGALGRVGGSPVSDAPASLATVITPDGHYVYTTHMIPGTITGYRLGADGSMTRLAAGSVTLGVPVTGATISPDGRWLYVTVPSGALWGGQIRSFAIAATGALTASGATPAATESAIAEVAMTPNGRTLVATNYLNDTLTRYQVGGGGQLTQLGSTIGTGHEPVMPVFTPDGRFLYVSNEAGASVSGYRVSADGTLSPIPGSPFATPATPHSEAVSPDGRYVFIADSGVNKISTFRIDSGGRLLPVATIRGPGSVGRVLLTPDGHTLLAIEAIGGIMGDPPLNLPTLPAPGATTPTLPSLALPGLPAIPLPLAAPIPGLTSMVASYQVQADGHLVARSLADTGVVYTDGTTAYLTPDQGPRAAVRVVFQSGDTMTFSGAASTDPDGRVARYQWSFGDGTSITTTVPTVSHVYLGSGTRTVTLVVTDDEGCSTQLIYDGAAVSCRGSNAARQLTVVRLP